MKKITPTLVATLLLAITFSFSAKASHLMGGEISWRCLSNGTYIFKMKVYRDCGGITFGTTGIAIDVHNYAGLTSIPVHLISDLDISPLTNCILCAGFPASGSGAAEELIFESDTITLAGTPPAAGWVFSYSNCCRNAAISNITMPGSDGFTLRAIMYAVNGQSANPCFDSSPDFAEKPNTTIGTGYDFHYTPFATDNELDSLVYAWGSPLDSWTSGAWTATNPYPLTFVPGYSLTQPFPGYAIDTNNTPATLNTSTGEITFKCFTPGVYNAVNKVTAYKCGVKCAEIFRDMQFTILPTALNAAPAIAPPFIDPNTSLPTLYDTVYAGDFVSFPIYVTDTGLQNITLEAAGNEFGGGFTDTAAGCLIPPCAILNPPPPVTAMNGVTTSFQWQTTTAHLGANYYCAYMPNTYYFLIRAKDDFCPAHAVSVAVIAITVLPVLPKPFVSLSNDTLQTVSITGYDYQWYKNRFKIPGANANAYRPTTPGYYQVRTIETATSDGNYSDSYHAVATGINIIDKNYSDLNISPNPSKGKFTVSDFGLKNFDLSITDAVGKIVYQKTFSNYNSTTLTVELKNMNDGIYFVELKSAQKSLRTKVMIQK